jgi:oxygen-independent coproporphyrinogen III oxidase
MSTTLTLAERAVPRYTSYPTAPQFSAAVGPDTYAEWLEALPDATKLSLYVHVPYCNELCLYCGCTTKAVRRWAPVVAYADHLRREIELVGAVLGGRPAVHLHWGGGTPSILGADVIVDLIDRLERTFDFSRIAEHAIELDPRDAGGMRLCPGRPRSLRPGQRRSAAGACIANSRATPPMRPTL